LAALKLEDDLWEAEFAKFSPSAVARKATKAKNAILKATMGGSKQERYHEEKTPSEAAI